MRPTTAALWAEQDRHRGDHHRLFRAVADTFEAETVLYPGSWCDLAPSFVWPSVTYVDTDRRAAQFFDDTDGVVEIAMQHGAPADPEIRFIRADYTETLPLPAGSFDLLVSMYAGPVSRHCADHLRAGGLLLANPSHGDAALASIDPRYELVAVVRSGQSRYRVTRENLDEHLVPKGSVEVTAELIERTGRGVAYTKSAFAYIFRHVRPAG